LEEHWRDIHVAMLHLQVMTKEAKEQFGPGLWTMPIKVDVEIQPKPNAVTLRRCVEAVAPGRVDDVVRVIERQGFSYAQFTNEARAIWECIGA
jgi:hypothetical protein